MIGTALSGRVEVYDAQGRALTDATAPLDRPAAIERARLTGRCVEAEPGVWLAAAAAGDEYLATLVLHPTEPPRLPERRTLERGAMVTALVLLFQRSEADAESRVRGELMADLLAGEHDPRRLHERARQRGADLEGPVVVAVAQLASADRQLAGRAASALASELGGLSGWDGDRLVLVVPGEDPVTAGRTLQDRLGDATVVPTIGVVGSTSGLGGIRSAAREARRCVDALVALGRAGAVSDPAGLGVARLLLGTAGPAELDDFVARTIGPVLTYDAERGTALTETLETWCDTGGSTAAAADQLHVHPNTVTQRLDRIGSLLGATWRGQILDIQLALRTHRLRNV